MSIELSEDQNKKKAELMNYILAIEKVLNTTVDQTNGENISYCLNEHRSLLATTPKMMEIATTIYNWAKGQAADAAMTNVRILDLKADVQRKWFDGQLAKWEGLYVRAERAHKDLDTSIKGLITLLSYDKSLTKNLQ